MLPYKVAKIYSKGPEQVLANFANSSDAKNYIDAKLEEDIALKVLASYRLYDMGELVETIDQTNKDQTSSAAGQGQQSANTQRFSPAPSGLQTTLRPSGMPPSSFKDVKDDDK